MFRFRNKDCFKCSDQNDVLYRCRYDNLKDWVFVCRECLKKTKILFENTCLNGGICKDKEINYFTLYSSLLTHYSIHLCNNQNYILQYYKHHYNNPQHNKCFYNNCLNYPWIHSLWNSLDNSYDSKLKIIIFISLSAIQIQVIV